MKKPTGSRALIVKQLKKVICEAIPRLETPEQADQMETQIFNARCAGILTDSEYLEMSVAIKEVCQAQGWA